MTKNGPLHGACPSGAPQASLEAQLDALRAHVVATAPVELSEALARADLRLAASGVAAAALKAGERMPDVTLEDGDGAKVRLYDLLKRGPLIVSFYRGGWCPYCGLELRAWQEIAGDIEALGASIVAVSPQTPSETKATMEVNGLTYPALSDGGSCAARRFGVVFDLAEELRPIFTQLGHPLPERNGVDSWALPIPATFIVAADGRVTLAHVDIDFRNRLEPSEALAAVRRLLARAFA